MSVWRNILPKWHFYKIKDDLLEGAKMSILDILKMAKKRFLKTNKECFLMTQGRPINTGHEYRLLIWVSRILSCGFIAGIFMNIISGVVILNLFPLKQVCPFFITLTPKSDQIVKVEPLEIETEGFDIMSESLAKTYVKLRETFDFQTEQYRWDQVYWFSSSEIFENFKTLINDNDRDIYGERKARKLQRDVIILSVSTLSKNPRILQVEWQSRDHIEGKELAKKNWISTLNISYEAQRIKFEDRYMNPLGFTVSAYGVSEKEDGALL